MADKRFFIFVYDKEGMALPLEENVVNAPNIDYVLKHILLSDDVAHVEVIEVP